MERAHFCFLSHAVVFHIILADLCNFILEFGPWHMQEFLRSTINER